MLIEIVIGVVVLVAIGAGVYHIAYLRGYSAGVTFALNKINKVVDISDNNDES